MDETAINASSVRSLKDETKNNSAAETPLNKEDLIVVGSINSVEDADDVVLRANGHDPAMQRQFKWLSALGLAFSITNSWVGYLVCVCLWNFSLTAVALLSNSCVIVARW